MAHVAIVGATGAVGVEMIKCLENRHFPVGRLFLFASKKSAGHVMRFRGEDVVVEELTRTSFDGRNISYAMFSAGSSVSKEFAPLAVAAGCVVVDNSSLFRMDPNVPLVVPEVNPEDCFLQQQEKKGYIIANPNCTTAIALLALCPLHKQFGLKRMICSSYQAVSGAGAKGMLELEQQLSSSQPSPLAADSCLLFSSRQDASCFARRIAFNTIPQVDTLNDEDDAWDVPQEKSSSSSRLNDDGRGYTREELKLERESRKMLHLPHLRCSATCVRVPVWRAHSVAVTAEFEKPVSLKMARAVLEQAPGLKFHAKSSDFPTPLDVAGKDDCAVGRLRIDTALDNAISFWIVGDQLLKGAALNAVQILELLQKKQPSK